MQKGATLSQNNNYIIIISFKFIEFSMPYTLPNANILYTLSQKKRHQTLAIFPKYHFQFFCTQPFNCLLSETTRVGQYHKKHSPTHTHPDHRTSFIIFLHLQRSMASSFVQFTSLTVLSDNLSPGPLWSSSWPWTLNFILHAFLHPFIIFSQHMPIPTQPVLLQYQRYVIYT